MNDLCDQAMSTSIRSVVDKVYGSSICSSRRFVSQLHLYDSGSAGHKEVCSAAAIH
jgi:hypothetical protein